MELVKESVQELESSLRRSSGTLKEAEAIGFSVLKFVMMLITGENASLKPRGWSQIPHASILAVIIELKSLLLSFWFAIVQDPGDMELVRNNIHCNIFSSDETIWPQCSKPSNEQDENWINELLEGSLRLVDLCGFSRDVVCLTKECVQDLESSVRRHKEFERLQPKLYSIPDKDNDLKTIGMMLKETEALAFSILKSVLILMAGEKERSKQRSWSLLSKFTLTSPVAENLCSFDIFKSLKSMDNIALQKKLKASEMTIEKLEEGLEALFRSLVKTRVSLLNVLNH
ncbi:UNVERIFIED_CONTAM: hypothetical protein Scaly_1552900 [Sesamum calycinum]|uniref:Uncharacterized protein n=1 Tax=Sesamum calycinum TaxID=2727403 RepID=A0AAW2P9B7_9LAMI